MEEFEVYTLIIAGFSLLVSIGAIYLSAMSRNLNKNMFKRQGVIDLHMAWMDIREIDKDKLITPDIIKAINTMSLTASLWNHDIIEKNILYETYWNSYRDLYDTLYNINELIPGKKATCRSLITTEISKAYEGMKNANLSTITQTYI
mgnify:CR=1 FL=1